MERVQIQGQRATLLSDQLARDPRHLAKGRLRQSILLHLGEVQILPRGGAAAVDGPHQALRDDQSATRSNKPARRPSRSDTGNGSTKARQGLRHTVGMRGGVDQMTGLCRQIMASMVSGTSRDPPTRMTTGLRVGCVTPPAKLPEMDPDPWAMSARAGHGIVDVPDGRSYTR